MAHAFFLVLRCSAAALVQLCGVMCLGAGCSVSEEPPRAREGPASTQTRRITPAGIFRSCKRGRLCDDAELATSL